MMKPAGPRKIRSRPSPIPSIAVMEPLEARQMMNADTLATAINVGTLSGARSYNDAVSATDVSDYYRFNIASQSNFGLALVGLAADADVQLLNSSGSEITRSANGGSNAESISRVLDAGTYYARVYRYSGNTNYTLSLTATPTQTSDPDDQISEAIQLGSASTSRTANGSISPATDVDMYAVDVTAGQRIGFDTDSNFDTYIRLFSASGTELARNDDGAAPGESGGLDSYLEYTFSQGGRYYLAVSGYGNSGYSPLTGAGDANGSTGNYTLVVTNVTPSDPDDQISEAVQLGSVSTSRTATGSISPATDVDMYAVDVTAGQRIGFDADSNFDTYIRLFNASGTELARNDDGAAPGESRGLDSYLEYTFNQSGRYYLAVSGYGNSGYSPLTGAGDANGSTGNYTLVVTRAAPTLHLSSVGWGGSGAVSMTEIGTDSWTNDSLTGVGDHAIPSGLSSPVWLDANLDGDVIDAGDVSEPVACVRGTLPILRATLDVGNPNNGVVTVRATTVDSGSSMTFVGTGVLNGSRVTLDLTTSNSVGNAVTDRNLSLRWDVSTDGGSTFQTIGTSGIEVFVLYNRPLSSATQTTARRVDYAVDIASGQNTVLAIAQAIANVAQNRFNANYFYSNDQAWNVVATGGDCGSCSWLQSNALAELGVPAEVRYVFPRHASWSGLWSLSPTANEYVNGHRLIYVNGSGNNYEGCCFVTDGSARRYYLGGYGGSYETSAYNVLMRVAGPNTSQSGPHQAWADNWNVLMSFPSGLPSAAIEQYGTA